MILVVGAGAEDAARGIELTLSGRGEPHVDTHPNDDEPPSDTDVQAERQP